MQTGATEVGADKPQKAFVKMGRGAAVQSPTASAHAEENGDISLNFVNAAVHDVVDSVLGQMLALNYTIDPKLQATITMQTMPTTSCTRRRGAGAAVAMAVLSNISQFSCGSTCDFRFETIKIALRKQESQ